MKDYFKIILSFFLMSGLILADPVSSPVPQPKPVDLKEEMERTQAPKVLPAVPGKKSKLNLANRIFSGDLDSDDMVLLVGYGLLSFSTFPAAMAARFFMTDRSDKKKLKEVAKEVGRLENVINSNEFKNELNELGYKYQVAAAELKSKIRALENDFSEYANKEKQSSRTGEAEAFFSNFSELEAKIKEAIEVDSYESWRRFNEFLKGFQGVEKYSLLPESLQQSMRAFQQAWDKEDQRFQQYETKVKEMILPLLLTQEPLLRMKYRKFFPLSGLEIPFYLPEFEATVKEQTHVGLTANLVKFLLGNEKDKKALANQISKESHKLYELRRVEIGKIVLYSPSESRTDTTGHSSGDPIVAHFNHRLCRAFYQKITDKHNAIEQRGYAVRNRMILGGASVLGGLALLRSNLNKAPSGSLSPETVAVNLQYPAERGEYFTTQFARQRESIRARMPKIEEMVKETLEPRLQKTMGLEKETKAIVDEKRDWLLDHIISISINDAIELARISRPNTRKELEQLFEGKGKFAGIYHARFMAAYEKSLADNIAALLYQDVYKNIPLSESQKATLANLLKVKQGAP